MTNYNYKCVVNNKGGKQYYKNVGGKWKRISNKLGMKAEKGKRKYGGSSVAGAAGGIAEAAGAVARGAAAATGAVIGGIGNAAGAAARGIGGIFGGGDGGGSGGWGGDDGGGSGLFTAPDGTSFNPKDYDEDLIHSYSPGETRLDRILGRRKGTPAGGTRGFMKWMGWRPDARGLSF